MGNQRSGEDLEEQNNELEDIEAQTQQELDEEMN